jgi:bifunctional non-homologous end joining protein LigD
MRADGTSSFSEFQATTDERRSSHLVYFVFDLLFVDGEDITEAPLIERKKPPAAAAQGRAQGHPIQRPSHIGDGKRFLEAACKARAEGIVSKRIDAAYAPGDSGLWRKSRCRQMEEFVVVDYKGSRPLLGALLLAYYDDDGQLV